MRYQCEMTLRHAEGALVRVLGTTERRGFRPVSFEGDARVDSDRWKLRMTVEGDRAPGGRCGFDLRRGLRGSGLGDGVQRHGDTSTDRQS